jgi:pSer/pThr/pTyr-binding forkhead associated (FHA) protein
MTVKMLVVQGRPAGKTLVFPDGVYYIGRGAECHVRPNSEWVSRQHCMVRVAGGAVYLRDLGSRNGTLVNGVLLTKEQLLSHGDAVQVGPLVFEVRLEDSNGRTPPSPKRPLSDHLATLLGKDRATEYGSTQEFPIYHDDF